MSDRYGEKPLLVAFSILSAAGGIVAGFAGEVWHLTLAFVLIGLGTSIYHPVGLALISKGVRRSARAMGINGLFGSLGTALSPLAARQKRPRVTRQDDPPATLKVSIACSTKKRTTNL